MKLKSRNSLCTKQELFHLFNCTPAHSQTAVSTTRGSPLPGGHTCGCHTTDKTRPLKMPSASRHCTRLTGKVLRVCAPNTKLVDVISTKIIRLQLVGLQRNNFYDNHTLHPSAGTVLSPSHVDSVRPQGSHVRQGLESAPCGNGGPGRTQCLKGGAGTGIQSPSLGSEVSLTF